MTPKEMHAAGLINDTTYVLLLIANDGHSVDKARKILNGQFQGAERKSIVWDETAKARLFDEYVTQGMSVRKIAEGWAVPDHTIRGAASRFGFTAQRQAVLQQKGNE